MTRAVPAPQTAGEGLAVTVFQGQVSPLLEEARHLLVLGPRPGQRRCLRLERPGQASRPEALRALGVGTLICGAACRETEALLRRAGIRVESFVAGRVEEVLRAFAQGGLGEGCFCQPGCSGRRACGARGRRARAGNGN